MLFTFTARALWHHFRFSECAMHGYRGEQVRPSSEDFTRVVGFGRQVRVENENPYKVWAIPIMYKFRNFRLYRWFFYGF